MRVGLPAPLNQAASVQRWRSLKDEDRAVPPHPHLRQARRPFASGARRRASLTSKRRRGHRSARGARVHRVGCRNTPAAVHDPRAVRPQRHLRRCRPLVASRLLAPPPHRVSSGAGGGELGGKHVRLWGGKGKPQQMRCGRRGRFIATPNDCGFDHRHVPGKRQHSDLVAADGSHRARRNLRRGRPFAWDPRTP